MSLLGRIINASSTGRNPTDDFWYESAGQMSTAGQRVTPDRAMQTSAVYGCVRILAETLASLPAVLYRRQENGGKVRADDRPLYQILHDRPNNWQTAFEFYEMMQGHVCLRGNAYAEILSGPRGAVDQLVPIHPDRVKVEQIDSNRLRYLITENGRERPLMDNRVFHVRGLSSDGIVGLNPIEQARNSIGMALAAEDYGARFFKNDATPGGVIEYPGHFKDIEAFNRFKREWQEAQSGANRGSTAILEDGMKFHELAVSNKDSQFLETRHFQVADIARLFRVPLVLLQETEKSTSWGSGIEQFMLAFVTHTMRPWLVRWEQAISRDLVVDTDNLFVEFLTEALLRGDTKNRYDAYGSSIDHGWMTRNEVRKKENMNPLPGLDEPLQPMNMGNAEAVARKEVVAVSEAYENKAADEFQPWAVEYYQKFRKYLREQLPLSITQAQSYIDETLAELEQAEDMQALFTLWETEKPKRLMALMEAE